MADSTYYILCVASSFAFILTFFLCGLVRWFHMCRPYGENESYYYPARRIVTISYFAACLQFPYLFYWHSPDAWLLVRSFFIIYVPTIGALAFRKFFFTGSARDRYVFAIAGGLPFMVILVLFVLAWLGGGLTEIHGWLKTVVVAVSLSVTAYLLYVTVCLRHQINDFIRGEYSSDEDFPVRFASSIVFVPLLATIISWGVFLCDSRAMTAALNVVMMVTGFVILLVILHPQRNGSGSAPSEVIGIIESSASDSDELSGLVGLQSGSCRTGVLPEYIKDRLEQQIRMLVSERQLFLRPGLKRSDLSEILGSNRTYLSIVFKERFGSFYSYINRLRIEYAIGYAGEHPDADRQEIAVNSGFGSVKTYDRVKKAYMAGEL